MRSTYKKLGPYIREIKVKNSGGACSDLRGVSIRKEFMLSVANVHGTDLSKYKRVKKHQFAFNPMHVGRDEVLPIALLVEDGPIIVSPAYTVFEVRDQDELLPEYLMMWCRRPEFDRNAWFTTDNSVRGGFSWDNFCEMKLSIPSIEKQREIVNEYQTVVDRIRLNERLNEKLEEAARAIYKQWFVDFEFPMTAGYAGSIDKPELVGQPYKSSGGEMEFNEVIGLEIPRGWCVRNFTEANQIGGGGTPDTSEQSYWGGVIPFFTGRDVTKRFHTVKTEKFITQSGLNNSSARLYDRNTTFLVARGATTGNIAIAGNRMAMNQSCYAILSYDGSPYYTHLQTLHLMTRMREQAIGGAIFNAIVTKDLEYEFVAIPSKPLREQFERILQPVYEQIYVWAHMGLSLETLRATLLSRIAIPHEIY